jgi:hypothetical protein
VPEINRLRVSERPPMRQYVMATAPNGKTYRFGGDEPNAEQVVEDLEDSSSAPGGNKELTGRLARKPSVDYGDMKMGTKIEVFGAGQRKISEYRLERAPRSSGDYLVMDPAAVGYQTLLTDNEEALEIFVDSDVGSWGDPSAQRRSDSKNAGYPLVASTSTGFDDKGEAPAGIIFDFSNVSLEEGRNEAGEQSYYGGGVDIGEVRAGFQVLAGSKGSAPWTDNLRIATDDIQSTYKDGTDLNATTQAGAVALVAPEAGYKYAALISAYTGTGSGTNMSDIRVWATPKIFGRSGVPIYGTWPEIGVLASDVIAYLIGKYVPGLNFTTGSYGSVRPSSFVIPHLAFKDQPVTVQEMVNQAIRFELLEWGVWPGQFGPTFFLNPRGQREGRKRWRTRMGPAKFTETGQQMDQVWNRVVVSYPDVDGTTRTIGPIGSGFRVTDARCEDVDPLNPLNEAGENRTKHIALNDPATQEGAAETAQRFLEQVKLLDGSGSAELTGFVEDEHGMEWPYYCVDGGDEIEILGSSAKGFRYIVEAKRSRRGRSVSITIDAPPDAYAALLERLGAREAAQGF